MTLDDRQVTHRCAIAIEAAKAAGQLAVQMQREVTSGAIEVLEKGPQDFVTQADRNAEQLIRDHLLNTFPDDIVIGEEFGGTVADQPIWIVDPIDGTANYVRALPHWGVSIALVHANRVLAGVICDPPGSSVYHAVLQGGAYCNGKRIRASGRADPSRSLAILGTSSRVDHEDHLALLRHLRATGAETRRFGSAAIGLAYVSEGLADAYFEASLNSWDALAGLLIAQEAGAETASLPLQRFLTEPGPVLCGSGAMVEVVRAGLPVRTQDRLTAWRGDGTAPDGATP